MGNIFEHSNQLEITNRERERSLESLFLFLRENPTSLGNVLLGLEEDPWTKKDVRTFETLILKRVSDEKQIADFLSIARSAAHLWSVCEGKVIHLPRHFVPSKKYDSPFTNNYAPAVARYSSWRERLSSWIYVLFPDNSAVIEDRSLLLAVFITSAICMEERSVPIFWSQSFARFGRKGIELLQSMTESISNLHCPGKESRKQNSVSGYQMLLLRPSGIGLNRMMLKHSSHLLMKAMSHVLQMIL
jgi:hypothetical protein